MKRRMMILLLVLAAVLLAGNAYAVTYEIYRISDNPTGGDCTKIGNWNWPEKTCTLTRDLTFPAGVRGAITFESDGVTLDGDGHILTGANEFGLGAVIIHKRNNVTVRNIVAVKYSYGVRAEFSRNLYLENINTFYTGHAGIYFGNVQNSAIMDSTVTGSYYGITVGADSNYNLVDGNTITENTFGFYHCCKVSNNIIRNNTFDSNKVYGLLLYLNAYDNLVYNNNFINNRIQAGASYHVGGNAFNLDAPIGGNYWSNFDTPEEGCFDTNQDGFCDAPYSYVYPYTHTGDVMTDYLPLTHPVGRCDTTPAIEITSLSPESIWPPNHKATDITLTGTITVPASCTLESATYELTDEYGEYSSTGDLVLTEDNTFTLTVAVDARRNGDDLDGRTYSFEVTAADEAGETTSIPVASTVLHDMRR